MLVEKLSEHGASRLIQGTATGDTQNWVLDSPRSLKVGALYGKNTGASTILGRWVMVVVIAQILDDFFHCIEDRNLFVVRELSTCCIGLRQCQRRQGNRIIVG